METYHLKVAGLERDLPVCPLGNGVSIAGFVMFSDVELTIACATELLKKVPDCDVFLTAESKGIPLAYEMSRQSGKRYILARKSKKLYMKNAVEVDVRLYMKNAVEVDVRSITTAGMQKLYLSGDDMAYLKGKRVLLVDDVISTGESLHALEMLTEKAGGTIVGKSAVLAEGDAANRDDIIFLGRGRRSQSRRHHFPGAAAAAQN